MPMCGHRRSPAYGKTLLTTGRALACQRRALGRWITIWNTRTPRPIPPRCSSPAQRLSSSRSDIFHRQSILPNPPPRSRDHLQFHQSNHLLTERTRRQARPNLEPQSFIDPTVAQTQTSNFGFFRANSPRASRGSRGHPLRTGSNAFPAPSRSPNASLFSMAPERLFLKAAV